MAAAAEDEPDWTGILGIFVTGRGATNECSSRSFRCVPVWYPDVIVVLRPPVVALGDVAVLESLEPLVGAPLSGGGGGGGGGDRIGGRVIFRGRRGDRSSRRARYSRLLALYIPQTLFEVLRSQSYSAG